MGTNGTHVTELVVGMRVRRTHETHDGAEIGTVVKVDAWELGTPYAVVEYSDGTRWSGTDYAWTLVVESNDEDEDEHVETCPACGAPIDYCQGHGEMGDPNGAAILAAHDNGNHKTCNPAGCDDAPAALRATLAENGRAVHVWWSGVGAMPSMQAFTGAARAASGGHPIKFRRTAWDTHGPAGTFVYSRRVR